MSDVSMRTAVSLTSGSLMSGIEPTFAPAAPPSPTPAGHNALGPAPMLFGANTDTDTDSDTDSGIAEHVDNASGPTTPPPEQAINDGGPVTPPPEHAQDHPHSSPQNSARSAGELVTRNRIETLDKRLDTRTGDLQGQINGLRTDVNGLQSQVTSLQGQVNGLQGQVNGLQGQVNGMQGQIDDLRGDVNGLRGEVTDLRGEVTGLRGELSAFGLGMGQRMNSLDGKMDALMNFLQSGGLNNAHAGHA